MSNAMETGSLVNLIYSSAAGTPAPEVGMGATVLMWTDRKAGTITEVTADSFTVRLDTATRTDGNGMSECQDYTYAPNPDGATYRFKRVARGKAKGAWRENGRKDGIGVLIGKREQYFDFSF
jgi:hypothetical protein